MEGEGALGFTTTSGNTDSENLNAKLSVSRQHEKWKHSAAIEALKSSTDNVTSADRFVFTEKTEYKYGKKTYSYVSLRYENDEFSGFVYQSSISIGIGSNLIESDVQTLDASIGPGYKRSKDEVTRLVTEDGIIKLGVNYKFIISKNAEFLEDILVESGVKIDILNL